LAIIALGGRLEAKELASSDKTIETAIVAFIAKLHRD
jgi:hypothetical protein